MDGLSHQWYDPVAADGYNFVMTNDRLFTAIDSLPGFLGSELEVLVNGVSLGLFGAHDSLNFNELLGQGVSSFSLRGIDPEVDGSDPLAFPIQLAFNRDGADFTMTAVSNVAAVPEPETYALMAVGLGLMGFVGRRRKLGVAAA